MLVLGDNPSSAVRASAIQPVAFNSSKGWRGALDKFATPAKAGAHRQLSPTSR
jgi:hypothetical protein